MAAYFFLRVTAQEVTLGTNPFPPSFPNLLSSNLYDRVDMESLSDAFVELSPFSIRASRALNKQVKFLKNYPNEYLTALLREMPANSDPETDSDSTTTPSHVFLLSLRDLPVTTGTKHQGWRIGKESVHPAVKIKRGSVFQHVNEVCLPLWKTL